MAVENGWEMPESWIGYSQPQPTNLPLRTEALTNAEVLRFRDEALHDPLLHPSAVSQLVHDRFGDDVLAHVKDMTRNQAQAQTLRRGEPVARYA